MARFSVALAILVFAYGFLVFRVYDLQLVKGEYYLLQSESRYFTPELLKAARGTIYFTDKNGNHLSVASNKNFPIIYLVPKAIDDPTEVANRLGPILNQSVDELEKKLSKKDDSYELLVKKADQEVARKITEMGIKGVFVETVPERFYPNGPLAAQLLGFVGPNKNDNGESGHYGVEEFYDDVLAGKQGEVVGKKIITPKTGTDLVLTIDPSIQVEAGKILANLVKDHNAKGGTIIVQEPNTGKILAMVSNPDFDPNNYAKAPLANFINPAIQQIYEPGSGFKVITMAAGIDSGKITPETTYFDTGSLTLNGRTIQNYDLKTHGPYGKVTMTSVIEHSINTGAVFAERQTGRDLFRAYLEKFGFGEKTDITLPGELKGDIRRLNPKERDIAFATAAYGQGVAVTPLGLIRGIGAIANGGLLMRPYLDANLGPYQVRRVVSEDTARKVTQMMISAVDKANVTTINGYSLAGKTGTAFIPDFKDGGYTDNVINTYVGFGPTTNPRFIALLKLNDPEGAPVAALTVVPAFRELAQFILNYYDIPPDRL